MNRTCALIPARSGSKGIKDKNIVKIGGRVLLEWSIQACKRSKHIDEIIITTDSKEYAELALNLGASVPFLRPKEISTDYSTDYEFIEHFLNWQKDNGKQSELIAHIRPTTPFRDPKIIDEAIEYYLSSKINPTSLRSVHPMAESAYKTFEISNLGTLSCVGTNDPELDKANEARQSFPETYVANGYIDILSREFIQRNKKIHGDKVLPFITPITHELDRLEDVDYLEFQLNRNKEIFSKVFK